MAHDPLTVEPTTETGRRVGSVLPTIPVPGETPVYIIDASGDLYIAQDDLGLIIET